MYKNRTNKGFTLAEVMIAVAVIGILSSAAMYSYGEARADARDSIRKTELEQIKTALIVYKADEGNFPLESDGFSGGTAGIICTDSSVCSSTRMNTPINSLIGDYIGEGVADPLHNEGSGEKYWYYYDGQKDCSSSYYAVTLHVRKAESDNGSNVNEIASNYCPNFSSGANEGGGITDNTAYLIILDYVKK